MAVVKRQHVLKRICTKQRERREWKNSGTSDDSPTRIPRVSGMKSNEELSDWADTLGFYIVGVQ